MSVSNTQVAPPRPPRRVRCLEGLLHNSISGQRLVSGRFPPVVGRALAGRCWQRRVFGSFYFIHSSPFLSHRGELFLKVTDPTERKHLSAWSPPPGQTRRRRPRSAEGSTSHRVDLLLSLDLLLPHWWETLASGASWWVISDRAEGPVR